MIRDSLDELTSNIVYKTGTNDFYHITVTLRKEFDFIPCLGSLLCICLPLLPLSLFPLLFFFPFFLGEPLRFLLYNPRRRLALCYSSDEIASIELGSFLCRVNQRFCPSVAFAFVMVCTFPCAVPIPDISVVDCLRVCVLYLSWIASQCSCAIPT
jgi:hypothetical protein